MKGKHKFKMSYVPVSEQEVSVGMEVRYHSIIGEGHDGRVYRVSHVGEIPSFKGKVAWLEGRAGCFTLDALSKYDGCEAGH